MPPVSTVRVTFEGMLLLFLNDNRDNCFVGFLKDIPHHYSEVQITRIPRGGAAEILKHFHGTGLKDRLVLDTNKPNQKVRLYISSAPPFPRAENADPTDFRWAVDLEGHEVYDRMLKPGVALDRLKPVLRMFDGMFYAQPPLSTNELTRQRFGETEPVRLGKVAVKLRADIELNAGQIATFINGTGDDAEVPLPASPDIDYGIYVCNKRGHDATTHDVDAENYHGVVAGTVAPSRRVRFDRHPPHSNRVTPDAVCLPAWMSKTEE